MRYFSVKYNAKDVDLVECQMQDRMGIHVTKSSSHWNLVRGPVVL